jgi:alkyl hydroperoxide reductase subunit D
MTMTLEQFRDALPETARDIKLNLQAVLTGTVLTPAQLWGVAVASAATARNAPLRAALLAEARAKVDAAVIDDALAAAALMAMNNVYYRFRHQVGKDVYNTKPARLRMNRLAKPATNKPDFELFSLAASAIEGCEMCVRSHEHAVLEGGLSEEAVHDAVRVAATIHAAAVSFELVDLERTLPAAAA